MLLLTECLRSAQGEEAADRFREQQIAGANPPPSTTQPSAAGSKEGAGARVQSSVLAAIRLDPKPYQEAMAHLIKEDYASWMGRGNLLLLADQPKEARAAFERAYALAPEKDLALAAESLAKCLKAEDGTIGRANAWVLSIRPQPPAGAGAGAGKP